MAWEEPHYETATPPRCPSGPAVGIQRASSSRQSENGTLCRSHKRLLVRTIAIEKG